MKSSSDPPLTKASRKPMSKDRVPAPLHGLLPVVQRWGAVASDEERYNVADFATLSDERIAELEGWANSWTPAIHRAFDEWDGRTQLTESYEFCKFCYLLMMLDELEIQLTPSTVRPEHVTQLIADLQVFDQIGAVPKRKFAARFLCDMEDDGTPAIAALSLATEDPSDQVRIWAHAALAIITRKPGPHREAMRAIAAEGKVDEFDADAAFEALDKTSEERVISRLCGAAITNDLTELRKLIGRVNVDRTDHNGQRAAFYAVGNGHPEALQLLLEAGADANQRDQHNRRLLHTAATRRRGHFLIELLLKHGADPTLKDGDGRTALEIAIEFKRPLSVALLKTVRPKSS